MPSRRTPRGSRFLVWRPTHNFAPGDLIAYWQDGLAYVGRVVRSEGGVVSVNRNGRTNAVVSRDAILGKVMTIYWRGSRSAPAGSQTQATNTATVSTDQADSWKQKPPAQAPAPEDSAIERNPEVLRIRLGQAEAELARLKQLRAEGVVTEADLDAAQEKAEVLKAELEGDDVGVAKARLAAAKRAWERVSPLAKAGIVTTSEAEAAQTEVRVREAELKAAQAARGLNTPLLTYQWLTNAPTGQPASALQFRLVADDTASNIGTETMTIRHSGGLIQPYRVLPEVLLDDSVVALAGIDFDSPGNRLIQIRFTEEGAKRFGEITATNINRQLAIVFHGRLISAPRIEQAITGGRILIGGAAMSAGDVSEIVDALNRAPKPTSQMWEFTPPRQCALLFLLPSDAVQGWLDLDSGLLITNKSRDWEDRAGHDWIQTNGFDLTALTGVLPSERVAFLCGFDVVVAAAPTNSWDTLTIADVVHNWYLLNHLPQQRRNLFNIRGQNRHLFLSNARRRQRHFANPWQHRR